MIKFWVGLCLVFITGCQQQISMNYAVQPSFAPARLMIQNDPLDSAKEITLKAQVQAEKLSPDYVLAHIVGENINQDGLTHPTSRWIISFVHLTQPQQALQIIAEQGQFKVKAINASELPNQMPLEERAWNIDSTRALEKALVYSSHLRFPLRLELTQISRRLVWMIPQNQPHQPPLILDAMKGVLFEP